MNALESGARDPETGSVTTDRLKAYLRPNIQLLLSTAELADPAIAKAPEFFDPEPFDIVPAPSPPVAAPAMQTFAVRIVSRIAGAEAALFDATLKQRNRCGGPTSRNIILGARLFE